MWVQFSPPDRAKPYRELVHKYGSPLLILDCEQLRNQYQRLQKALPEVSLYYAVKSLPSPVAIEELFQLGSGFDLASSGEIALIQRLGIPSQRTIQTHPVKTDRDIRCALRYGCTTFVVDNPLELQKFVRYRHRVGLLIRVGFRNTEAQVDLASKFGCAPYQVPWLIEQARGLGVHIRGLSFHVGSQSLSPDAHVRAISESASLFTDCTDLGIAPMSLLDIGGGFPVGYSKPSISIEDFCLPLVEALGRLPKSIHVIAEPGRYISAPSMTLICSVIGKSKRSDQMWYYLDDGLYGSFSGQVYDHASYPLTVFANVITHERGVLAGPTCDSIDVIAENIGLPDMGLGDLVLAHQIGAYSTASATDFNAIERAKIIPLKQTMFTAHSSALNL